MDAIFTWNVVSWLLDCSFGMLLLTKTQQQKKAKTTKSQLEMGKQFQNLTGKVLVYHPLPPRPPKALWKASMEYGGSVSKAINNIPRNSNKNLLKIVKNFSLFTANVNKIDLK